MMQSCVSAVDPASDLDERRLAGRRRAVERCRPSARHVDEARPRTAAAGSAAARARLKRMLNRGVSSSNSSKPDSSTSRRISFTSSGSARSFAHCCVPRQPGKVAAIAERAGATAAGVPAAAGPDRLRPRSEAGGPRRPAVDRPLDVLRPAVVALDPARPSSTSARDLVGSRQSRARRSADVARTTVGRPRGPRRTRSPSRRVAAHDLARHLRDEEGVGRDVAADDRHAETVARVDRDRRPVAASPG